MQHRHLASLLLLASFSASALPPPNATLDAGPKVGYENFEAPGVFTNTVQSNGNTTEYLGRGAGEPSLGVNWQSPAPNNVNGVTNFQSDLQTIFVTFDDSCPAGGKKSSWANRPAPTSQGVDSDPIGFTNVRTGRVFAAELTLLSPTCKVSYTDSDGLDTNGDPTPAGWTPTTGPGGAGVDHQTIGGGPYHEIAPGVPPPYASAGLEAFYYCSQDIAAAYCLRSDDGGLSWQPQTQMYTLATCGGLHGHVKVSPAEGTVYVPNNDCGSGIGAVAVSENNGATWAVRYVQAGAVNLGGSSSDPAVGIDAAGRVYFAIASGDQFLGVGTSTDRGTTWQNLADVTTQLGLKGIRYPAAVGGSAGRAAIAFLGTTTAGNFNGSTFWGVWHVYVAHTFDGGASWSVTDATPDLPVQRGCIWTNGGGDICRNLLDFFDVAIDKLGRVQVGYVNGCPGGSCSQAAATARGNDYSATATIARQSSGRRLLTVGDPQPATSVPGMPTVTARRVGTIVHLGWSEGDTGNSPILEYQIWRGTATGAGKTLVATVAGNQARYDDKTATDVTATYYYDVLAVNAAGTSCANNEITVAYMGDTCPGLVIHQNDPAHPESAPVQNGQNSNLAIDYIAAGEPITDLVNGSGTVIAAKGTYLMFKLKVSTLATVPPDSRWRMVWDTYASAGQLFYVGARSGPSGAPTFDFGRVGDAGLPAVLVLSETKTGDGLLGSSFNADGTMTIYVPKSGVGNPLPGDLLGALGGKTFTGDSGPAGNYQRSTALVDHTFIKGVTDNSFPAATYMLRDAEHVTDNHVPVLTLDVDTTYGNPPLTVNFTTSQTDVDGDAPGAYKFDYGDGTPAVIRSCGNAPYLTPTCATPSHVYANPGYYTATVWPLDSCGQQGDPLTVLIHVNAPPVADAGADFAIVENATAMLSGSGSSDADGDALAYAWTQTAGPAVTLSAADTATPSFTAPAVSVNTPLTFQLTVTDQPLGLNNTDTVTVTVLNANLPPVADAGADFDINEGQTAMLSGAGSSDPDNDTLGYSWAQTAGPPVALSGANTATPSFPAPAVAADAVVTLQLTVTDQPGGLSASDSITVTVHNVNLPPVANAGPDVSVNEREIIALSGSASVEPDGDALTYSWTQVAGPTAAAVAGVDSAAPSYRAPSVAAVTPLTFRLTVSDPQGASSTDDVVVTVVDVPQPQVIGNNETGALSPLGLLLLGACGLLRRRRR